MTLIEQLNDLPTGTMIHIGNGMVTPETGVPREAALAICAEGDAEMARLREEIKQLRGRDDPR